MVGGIYNYSNELLHLSVFRVSGCSAQLSKFSNPLSNPFLGGMLRSNYIDMGRCDGFSPVLRIFCSEQITSALLGFLKKSLGAKLPAPLRGFAFNVRAVVLPLVATREAMNDAKPGCLNVGRLLV